MKLFKVLMLVVSVAILGAIIWYSNPVQLAGILSNADLIWIFAGFVVFHLSLVLRVYKWKVILPIGKGIGFRSLFPVQLLGMTLSNFTPGKAGEPLKAVILKAQHDMPVSMGLSSIIWERILDLIVLIILSVFFVFMISIGSDLFFIGLVAVLIFAVLISLMLVVLMSKRIGMKIFTFIKKFPILNRISDEFIENFYKTAGVSKRALLLSFIMTFIVWVSDGAVFAFVFMGLGYNINFMIMAGLISFSALVGVASFLPGGLGSADAVMIVLVVLLGATNPMAAAGILLGRFLTFWYSALLGGASFVYISKKLKIDKLSDLT